MDRTGRPEQVMSPALRAIIKKIDLAIENGSLDPKDRDEVIKMFISGPTQVVDSKAGGGMMNINDMIRPLGFEKGGSMSREELETALKSLNISLMLEESFLGGGNSAKLDQIKKQIKQIELMIGDS